MYTQAIHDFIRREGLPESFRSQVEKWYLPLLELLLELVDTLPQLPLVVGINGSQGSGKTTLARLLQTLLQIHGRNAAVLSIDDFYLDSASRRQLASAVHPLLATRGVPGTHDVALALTVLEKLKRLDDGQSLSLPAFDKAKDEPVPPAQRPQVTGRLAVIILEGWFVGCKPQQAIELQEPVNALEAAEDADGIWRNYVNDRLAGDYQSLFAMLDLLVMLRAPDFDCVLRWRQIQEDKLRSRKSGDDPAPGLMSAAELERFVQHYERLTRHCLQTLPASADILFNLDPQQRIISRQDLDDLTPP